MKNPIDNFLNGTVHILYRHVHYNKKFLFILSLSDNGNFKVVLFKKAFTTNNTIMNILVNSKYRVVEKIKSDIYEMYCNEISLEYTGQSRRSMEVIFKYYVTHLRFGCSKLTVITKNIKAQLIP